jgi:hypothetical protein
VRCDRWCLERKTSTNPQKVSPLLLQLQADTPPSPQQNDERTAPVRVLIRTQATIDDEQQAELNALGVMVSTIAGDILSASVPLGSISRLSELEFVQYIDLSSPLYPEQDEQNKDTSTLGDVYE